MKDYSFKHVGALVLLALTVVYLMIMVTCDLGSLEYGFGYYLMFFLPKILPFTFMGLYLFAEFKIKPVNRAFRMMGWAAIALVLVVTFIFSIAALFNIPLDVFMQSYTWSYVAILEWAFCFIGCWLTTQHVCHNALLSTNFAVQAISTGGNLYEIPIYYANSISSGLYYHPTYPLIIATPWISLVSVILLMKWHGWKASYLFKILFVVFLFSSVIYSVTPRELMWLPRLPTVLLLVTIPLGFRKDKDE